LFSAYRGISFAQLLFVAQSAPKPPARLRAFVYAPRPAKHFQAKVLNGLERRLTNLSLSEGAQKTFRGLVKLVEISERAVKLYSGKQSVLLTGVKSSGHDDARPPALLIARRFESRAKGDGYFTVSVVFMPFWV
jgi:hypothetical protein